MNVDINVLEIIQFVINKYGLAGIALVYWLWHGHQLQIKVDKLQSSCNKMFGIMLALADKSQRPNKNGGSLDD